jgi:hypothetical protein
LLQLDIPALVVRECICKLLWISILQIVWLNCFRIIPISKLLAVQYTATSYGITWPILSQQVNRSSQCPSPSSGWPLYSQAWIRSQICSQTHYRWVVTKNSRGSGYWHRSERYPRFPWSSRLDHGQVELEMLQLGAEQ